MFWQCPSITNLWNQVFQLISSLTGIHTKPDPALALLHLNVDKFQNTFRIVITHILPETRLLILGNWNSSKAINISDIVTAVHRNYTFERLIAITCDSMNCKMFDNCWSIWPKCYGHIVMILSVYEVFYTYRQCKCKDIYRTMRIPIYPLYLFTFENNQ